MAETDAPAGGAGAAGAPPCSQALLDATVALVRDAAGLALAGFRTADLGIERKLDGTVVTGFDRAVERALREGILAAHPDDGILGEEEDDVVGTSGRRWVLDPIDGTAPFARGIVTWGTLVACDDRHGPLVAVDCCPWAGEAVWAGRGLGTWFDGRRVAVPDRSDLVGAVLVTSGLEWWPAGALDAVLAAGVKVKTWGNAYGVALAATGRVDAFFDAQVQPWDLGPAPLLASEAGLRFGDLDGVAHIDGGTGLIAPPSLFEPLRALLTGSGGEPVGRR